MSKNELENDSLISRRTALKTLAGAAAFAVGGGVASVALNPDARHDIDSILNRRPTNEGNERFIPENPAEPLSAELSKEIFEELNLAEEYPHTLTPTSFHFLSQRVGRVANLYFKNALNNSEHIKDFFGKIHNACDDMDVDFAGTLLMWQISGANNSSHGAQLDDIRDERLRMLLSLAETVTGSSKAGSAIGILRQFNLFSPYSWSRLEGLVSMGIHDIETIMIARGMEHVEKTLPDYWRGVEPTLWELAPGFMERYKGYLEVFTEFQNVSDSITNEATTLEDARAYLSKFDKQATVELLTTDGRVDDYQFSRTTMFWAHASEVHANMSMSAYTPDVDEANQTALKLAIQKYLELPRSSLFLDQISNPKMIEILRKDAEAGDSRAQRLWELSGILDSVGDRVINADRDMTNTMVREKTEQNADFQIITGVMHSRWLLYEATKHGLGHPKSRFDDKNELGYFAFMATGNRETPTHYMLAGTRPLHRATLPFGDFDKVWDHMEVFLRNVYMKFYPDPKTDYYDLARTLDILMLSLGSRNLLGAYGHEFIDDPVFSQFFRTYLELGNDERILTMPHCSWARALEATSGYVLNQTKN